MTVEDRFNEKQEIYTRPEMFPPDFNHKTGGYPTVRLFRKKTVIVKVWEWQCDQAHSHPAVFLTEARPGGPGSQKCSICGHPEYKHGETRSGMGSRVCPGDYLVKDSNGYLHVYRKTTFEEQYEEVQI